MRMWLVYGSASIRAQMQYRVSFVLAAAGQLMVTGIEFVGVWALFDRFGSLRGWTLAEVAVFYGVAHCGFALADMLGTGFDRADELIRQGGLDRLLLRPRTTVLQLLGYEVTLRRLGRFAQGGAVLVWAIFTLDLTWTLGQAVLLVGAIVSTGCLFLGLFALRATLSIFTVQALEVMSAATYGGVTAAQNPLEIYASWFRMLFTFVVPLACVAYFPVVVVIGKADPLGTPVWFGYVSPVAGPVFLAVSFAAWNWGVRRYTSTGS